MKQVHTDNEFAVFDDFLSPDSFELLWTFMQEEAYHNVNKDKWVKVFHLSDAPPWEGKTYEYVSKDKDPENKAQYPSGKAIDLLIKKIIDNIDVLERWVGKENEDWLSLILKPYLYPAHSALSWHDDYSQISGAFAYFCHKEWNVRWGGETFIANYSQTYPKYEELPKYKSDKKVALGPYFENKVQNELIMDPGVGYYVMPKPNRLLLIKPGVQHKINRVDQNIGGGFRCSIAGFFLNPEKSWKKLSSKGR